MSSLSDTFTSKVDSKKEREEIAHNLGMGDVADLESAGLMARNNAADKTTIAIERKKREKEAYERALEIITNRLRAIETEMMDLETEIADSREIIAKNNTDIDFIRSLDTEGLHTADGNLRDDVTALLTKYGYDDLDGKSEDEIRHMLTVIEVRAIEQNEREEQKIERWTDRHDQLRQDAREAVRASNSESHHDWANHLVNRDPEQLARDRIEAMAANDKEAALSAQETEMITESTMVSTGFSPTG